MLNCFRVEGMHVGHLRQGIWTDGCVPDMHMLHTIMLAIGMDNPD